MAPITIQDVRQKFPGYNDMSDEQLADALHQKFYADMPKEQFYGQIGLAPAASNDSFMHELAGGQNSTWGDIKQWGSDVGNSLLGVAELPYTATMGLSNAVNNIADFISGVNPDTGQPVNRSAMLNSAADTIENLSPANLIPGLGTAVKAGTDWIGDMSGSDKYLKSGAAYGADMRHGIAAAPATALGYVAPKALAMAGNRISEIGTGAPQARNVVNELRDLTGNSDFLSTPVTQDALQTQIATGIKGQAELARQSASSQFQDLGPGNIDISPVIDPMNRDLASKGGILPPDGDTATVTSNLNSMVPEREPPIPSSLVDPYGNPYPATQVPYSPEIPTTTGKLQNILRDVGAAGENARGTWGGTVLSNLKANLLKEAERQLPSDTYDSLMNARGAWEDYSGAYKEGAAQKAQSIIDNPDTRLNTLYDKLIQDDKSAGQLMAVMSDAEKVKAQSLVLQKMLEKNPRQWGSHIEAKRGAFNQIFGEDVTNGLSDWASGGSPGSDFAQQLPRRGAGSAMASLPAAMMGKVLGGDAVMAGIEAAGTVLGVNKGKSIMGTRNLLKQAAAGNPEAIASLNSSPNLPSQLTSLIGATGAGLSQYLGGAAPDTPSPLPRDFNQIKKDPSLSSLFTKVLQGIGLIPADASAEELPDTLGKNAVIQVAQIAPMLFQSPAGGYQSAANGKLNDPAEQDAHKMAALDLPAEERARVIGALFDGNKYQPINQNQSPVAPAQKAPDISLSSLSSGIDSALNSAPRETSDAASMLSQLTNAESAHFDDDYGFMQ